MSLRFMVLVALLGVAGCNQPADYAIVGSADVPSVQGDVEIEKIDKEQILVTVVLDQLPSPSQIEEGLTDFAVWFVVVGQDPVFQGTLEYDSKARVGRGSYPTALRVFELRVTAEPSPTPQAPNFILVASQEIREN